MCHLFIKRVRYKQWRNKNSGGTLAIKVTIPAFRAEAGIVTFILYVCELRILTLQMYNVIKRSEISWLPNLSGLRDLTGLNLQVIFKR